MKYFTAFAFLTRLIVASPSITFPINSQVPPIAVVAENYEFQFAPTAFSSDDPQALRYSLQNAPSWLSLESNSRTFRGTPQSTDVGPATFAVEATDDVGSTTMQVTLVVVQVRNIVAPASITSQLEKFGKLVNSDSLALYTNTAFTIAFASTTFQGPAGMRYYATSDDRSPLPSWVTFDSSSLVFVGLTPPLTQIPQTFGLKLLASTVKGFSDASVTFSLIINDHQLAFEPFQQTVDFSDGSADLSILLTSRLLLDGMAASPAELETTNIEGPPWLSYDSSNMTIFGSPPASKTSQSITVMATDRYGDSAQAFVQLDFPDATIVSEIGTPTAIIGHPFSYTIPSGVFRGYALSINLGKASGWLHLEADARQIKGEVPRGVFPTIIAATLIAASASNTQTQAFSIDVVKSVSSISSSRNPSPLALPTTTTGSGSDNKTTSSSATSEAENSKVLRGGDIAGIVIAIILFLSAVLGLIVWCCLRRRHELQSPARRRQRPHLRVYRPDEKAPGHIQDEESDSMKIESAVQAGSTVKETQGLATPPPRIEGSIPGMHDSIRSSKYDSGNSALHPSEETALRSIDATADGIQGLHTQHPSYAPSELAWRVPRHSGSRSVQHRLSRLSQRSIGLPDERFAVGLGHGRPSYQSLAYGPSVKSSIAHGRLSRLSSGFDPRRSRQTFSFVQQERHRSLISDKVVRPSIRLVDEPDDFHRRRESYLKKRTSSKRLSNGLFAGNSLRQSRRSHLFRNQWMECGARTSSIEAVPRPTHIVRDQARLSLDSAVGEEEWEDTTELDGSAVEDGEEILRNEQSHEHDTDLIVVARARDKPAQHTQFVRAANPEYLDEVLPQPETPPAVAGGETEKDPDSSMSGKVFL